MVYNSILVRPGLVVVEGFILTHHQDLKLGRGRVRVKSQILLTKKDLVLVELVLGLQVVSIISCL